MTSCDITLATVTGGNFRRAQLGDARLQAVNKAIAGRTGVDFRGADMTRVTIKNSNLSGSCFADANLRRADLSRCDLTHADLRGADLTGADLSFADLTGADLSMATLVGTMLAGTTLTGARLGQADLTLASFNGAVVADAQLGGTLWSKTAWARCDDLSRARGLDAVELGDPSSIDIHTLRNGIDALPSELLAHCGVDADVIRALRSLPAADSSRG